MPLSTTPFTTLLLLTLLTLLPHTTHAYSGEMTYHTVTQSRTCGPAYNNHGNRSPIVALSPEMMKPKFGRPKCGTWIGIWNPATKTKWKAMIHETCTKCGKYDISVSVHLFYNITNGYFPPTWPMGGRYYYGSVRVDWGGVAVGG
ncbi:MAG: hypothetical protein Q9208_004786 [Pyrenodesmia sp. 3 TL-2023]